MGTGTSTSSRRSSTRRPARSSSSRPPSARRPNAPRSPRAGVDLARRLLLALPGVEEGPCYGTPGFRVRGKFLARIREDGETLAVKCGDEQLEIWMQADPAAFFLTDHYRGYGTVLVRLPKVDSGALREVLVEAWRRLAPKTLLSKHGAGGRG